MKNIEKKATDDDDYDPFAHRNVEKPNSDLRSTANLIKASLGSGLLAGPLAFHNSGWAIGILGTIIIGSICGHCIQILVETSRRCCKVEMKPSLGYADTCYSAFSNGPKCVRRFAAVAKIVANISLVLTHAGICCVYTVLIGDSVKQLVDRYFPEATISIEHYCLILLIPFIILTQIRYLKWLAVLSLLANVLLVVTFAICLYYIFGESLSLEGRHAVGDPYRLPAFLSTVIFAMEGVGLVMPIENNMKKPSHFLGFPSVLVVALAFIVSCYTILGLFGYLRYGDVLRGSITLNLPMDEWPAICAKLSIALSIFFTYPLQYYVIIDTFWMYTGPCINDKYQKISEIVARIIGVIILVGLSIALPMLEQIIALTGAFFFSILGLMIPSIIETVFRWEDLGRLKWVLWKNVLIFIIGLICLVSGVSLTVSDIIKIQNGKTV